MPQQDLTRHRQRTFHLEAIVLRHIDWGEADRLIWLYSRELGKVRSVAKGVRKPRSRKAGHLEPFTRVNLLLAHGKDLPLITQAETIEAYFPLREDLIRTTYASYVIELLDRFTYEEGEHRALYRLLTDTLMRLCQSDDLDLVVRYFEVRLLDLVGFRPQLFQCVGCGEDIMPQDQFFSAHQGGVLCPKCGSKINEAKPISMAALKYLRYFQRSSYAESAQAKLAPPINREIEITMQHYLTYLLERGLNTPSFLRRVRKGIGVEDEVNEAMNSSE
jgi:DNA repair protein RecO (recombination protein O)